MARIGARKPKSRVEVSESNRQVSSRDVYKGITYVTEQAHSFGGYCYKIKQAVVVVVEKLRGHCLFCIRGCRLQLETSVTVADRKYRTRVYAHEKISKPVFVDITRRRAPTCSLIVQSDFLRHIAKCSVAQIAKGPAQ